MPIRPFVQSLRALAAALALAPLGLYAQASAGTRIEYPAGDQPMVITVPGPTRWVLIDGGRFTPVGPDSGRLVVSPAYDEVEDGAPNCGEMIDRPSDGVAVVPAHPAVPAGPGWHPAANTAGDMLIACLMLKDLRVLFEIRGFRTDDSVRLKPLLTAFGQAAVTRFGAAGRLR